MPPPPPTQLPLPLEPLPAPLAPVPSEPTIPPQEVWRTIGQIEQHRIRMIWLGVLEAVTDERQ